MKLILKWLSGILAGALTMVTVIVLTPYAASLADTLLPDISGAHIRSAAILNQQMQDSARLEATIVTGEGVVSAEVNALTFTVSTVNISYAYTGSYGIDLSKVQVSVQGNQLVFTLPQPEVLGDNISIREIYRDGILDGAVRPSDKDIQNMLDAEKETWRAQYLTGEYAEATREACIAAFERTVATWLSQTNSRLSCTYRWATPASE